MVREVELFKELPPVDVERLVAIAHEESYRRDEYVFREKDPATKLYVVLTGMIEIARPSRGGDAKNIRLLRLGRGEVFGELAMLDDGGRSASAMASIVPETHLAAWSLAELNTLFDREPAMAARVHRALARKLASRLRATSEAVFALLQGVLGKHLD